MPMYCEYCTSTKRLRNPQARISHYANAHWLKFVNLFMDDTGLSMEQLSDRGFTKVPEGYVCFICEDPLGPLSRGKFRIHLHDMHAAHVIKKML